MSEKKFDDWTQRCSDSACELRQIAYTAENKPVMQALLVKSAAGNYVAQFTLPLNVALLRGAQLVQGEFGQRAEFVVCEAGGCIARAELTDEMVGALRSGTAAEVRFISLSAGPIKVPFSLKGVTAGLRSL